MRPCRRGFTLVELLVVMTIIAVLTTMSLGGFKIVRDLLKRNTTVERIEAVRTAFTLAGQGEGSIAFALQRDAGLDGVLGWRQETYIKNNISVPYTDAAADFFTKLNIADPFKDRKGLDWTGIAYAKPSGGKDDGTTPYLRFPWGETPPAELLNPSSTKIPAPDPFYLRHCSPYKTREILAAINVIPRSTTGTSKYKVYMTDRSPKCDWNDAWGRPLVVGFAFYQPPMNNPQDNLNPNTQSGGLETKMVIFKAAQEKYKHTRLIYLTLAAMGPVLPPALSEEQLTVDNEQKWSGSAGIPAVIWKHVVVSVDNGKPGICQQGDPVTKAGRPSYRTGEWIETSFSNPPWSGIKYGVYKDQKNNLEYRSFLSTPMMFP